ncbi:MAG: hypothetical protein EOO88_45450 [Pedobacter sp.]|nr:MAG: hypothetical protein EOO88_45450 [Pedobacter sp.]
MSFTTSILTTIGDCDKLLSLAQADKRDKEFRKITLERKQENSVLTSSEIEADLSAVNAEIDAYETAIPGMPEGLAKEQFRAKLTKAVYKKFTLEERRLTNGVLAVLQNELELSCVAKDLDECELFITEITERKAEL